MKSTRNRKAKRGKTRRTRRKARTVHRGGAPWRLPWKKDNAVAPEPTINFGDLIPLLHKNGYTNTVKCLQKEQGNKKSGIDKPIYLCDAPCDSNPEPVAPITQSPAGLPLSTERRIESINVLTKEKPNRNGWYIEVEHDRNGDITSIENANLKKMSGVLGNINNYSNSNFEKYMNTINDLPNPSYSYSTDIEGVINTFSLKSADSDNRLLWVDSKNHHIMYEYNTAKPLTISINGKECTLTKVE